MIVFMLCLLDIMLCLLDIMLCLLDIMLFLLDIMLFLSYITSNTRFRGDRDCRISKRPPG